MKKKRIALRKSSSIDNGEIEDRIIKKENHRFLKIVAIASIFILLIILVACFIDIYNLCAKVHPYFGIGVISVLLLLFFIFVIIPIISALTTPCFTLDIQNEPLSKITRKNYRKLVRVGKNIIKTNSNVSAESKQRIKEALGDKEQLNIVLKEIYDTEISKDIRKLITKKATEVLVATAISQNNRFDALTTIIVNVRMIMQIVVRCGYHPTYAQLSKLTIKVLRNAFIAYTIQSLNLEDLILSGINKLVKGSLTLVPGINEVTKSITQGSANALLTLRIGNLTKKYLFEDYRLQSKLHQEELENEMLVSACQEADAEIDEVLDECKRKKSKVAI